VACCEEPHWVSTVVLATLRGRPAVSEAVRPTLKAGSPTLLTRPVTTWPTTPGSMPDRSITAMWTWARRSAGCTVDRRPLRRPIGVRTASTITTSGMHATYWRRVGLDQRVRRPVSGGDGAIGPGPRRPPRGRAG